MAGPASSPLEKAIRGILWMAQKMIREKAHGQIVITIRDGVIQLVDERRTYKPENLPES
jgi:hypothetical protein